MDSKLEKALERLEKGASAETQRALALAARILEARARMEDDRSLAFAALSEEAEKRVRTGKTTVLEETPAAVPAADLASAAERILEVVLEETNEAISEADRAALKAAAEYLDRDTLEDRPYPFLRRCPVCGGDPIFARVSETAANGSVRHLTCGTCGASWLWNRIGCPACGTNATRELKYVHDENDLEHRLYVCSHCGEILPTVFEADGAEASAPDELERVVLADLERAYRAAHP